MEDTEITALYWARSDKAIEETQSRYGRYCMKIAFNILGNREDSEECVNDAYMRAWSSIPPHRPEKLSAYLGKLTRNLALTRLERASRQKRGGGQLSLALAELEEVVSDGETPESELDRGLLEDAVRRWLLSQPADVRAAFVGRYVLFHSIRDIARKLGSGESRVKSILFRARSGLRGFLEEEGINV